MAFGKTEKKKKKKNCELPRRLCGAFACADVCDLCERRVSDAAHGDVAAFERLMVKLREIASSDNAVAPSASMMSRVWARVAGIVPQAQREQISVRLLLRWRCGFVFLTRHFARAPLERRADFG